MAVKNNPYISFAPHAEQIFFWYSPLFYNQGIAMQNSRMTMLGLTCVALLLCACRPGVYYPFASAKNPQQVQAKQQRAQVQAYVNSHANDYSTLVPVDQNGNQTVKPSPNRVNSIIAS